MSPKTRFPMLLACLVTGLAILLQPSTRPTQAAAGSALSAQSTSWVAFVGIDENIWLVRTDGSEKTQLTSDAPGTYYYSLPKWSADGSLLAFTRRQSAQGSSHEPEIVIMQISPKVEQLRVVSSTSGGYGWSAEGPFLYYAGMAFTGTDENGCAAYTTQPGGIILINALTGEGAPFYSRAGEKPVFLPGVARGDQRLVFALDSDPIMYGSGGFAVAAVPQGEPVPLVDSWSSCAWSPDGQAVACDTWRYTCDIYSGSSDSCPITIYSPGGEVKTSLALSKDLYDVEPKWSPDGRYLAVTASNGFFFADGPCAGGSGPDKMGFNNFVDVITVADGARRRLAKGMLMDWSPDGRFVLITHYEPVGGENAPVIYVIPVEGGGNGTAIAVGTQAVWQPGKVGPNHATRLVVTPLAKVDTYRIEWNNVEGTHLDYQARYSLEPITSSNWDSAQPITCTVKNFYSMPANCEFSADLPAYTKVYFAMRVIDQQGNVSDLSNVAWLIINDFWVGRDGFQYTNGGDGGFIKLGPEFTWQDMVTLVGPDPCILVDNCLKVWQSAIKDGECLGISLVASRLFYGRDLVFLDSPPEKQPVEMTIADIGKEVVIEQVIQRSIPQKDEMISLSTRSTIPDLLKGIQELMRPNADPQVLILGLDNNGNTHAVVPVGLEQFRPDTWIIWVYESNKLSEAVPMYIDETNQTWSYAHVAGKYEGETDPTSHVLTPSLYLIPVSVFDRPYSASVNWQNVYELVSSGPVLPLAVDKQGRRSGFADGQLVNEIPGAQISAPVGQEEEGSAVIDLSLPYGQNYQVILRPIPAVTGGGEASLSYISKDGFLSIDHIVVDEKNDYRIFFSEVPARVDILPGKSQENALSFALPLETLRGASLSIPQVALDPQQPLSLVYFPDEGRIALLPADGQTNPLAVELEQPSGETGVFSASLQGDSGSSYNFDLAGWDGKKPVPVAIDNNGDGRAEKTVRLHSASGALAGIPLGLVIGTVLILLGAGVLFAAKKLGLKWMALLVPILLLAMPSPAEAAARPVLASAAGSSDPATLIQTLFNIFLILAGIGALAGGVALYRSQQSIRCPACARKNPRGAIVCMYCGTPVTPTPARAVPYWPALVCGLVLLGFGAYRLVSEPAAPAGVQQPRPAKTSLSAEQQAKPITAPKAEKKATQENPAQQESAVTCSSKNLSSTRLADLLAKQAEMIAASKAGKEMEECLISNPYYSPDGKKLVLLLYSSQTGKSIYALYQTSNGKFQWQMPAGEGWQWVLWSPDSSRFIGSGNQGLHIIDAASGKELSLIPPYTENNDSMCELFTGLDNGQSSVSWLPNNRDIQRKVPNAIQVVDTSSGKPLAETPVDDRELGTPISEGRYDCKYLLYWSPDGSRFAAVSYHPTVTNGNDFAHKISVWRADPPARVWEMSLSVNTLPEINWSSDGTEILIADNNSRAVLFNSRDGSVTRTVPDPPQLPAHDYSLSPDGQALVAKWHDGLEWYDFSTGQWTEPPLPNPESMDNTFFGWIPGTRSFLVQNQVIAGVRIFPEYWVYDMIQQKWTNFVDLKKYGP